MREGGRNRERERERKRERETDATFIEERETSSIIEEKRDHL